MLYRPEAVLLTGFMTYLFVYLVAPLTPLVSLSAGSLGYIGMGILCFCIGSWLGDRLGGAPRQFSASSDFIAKRVTLIFRIFFVLGLIGIQMRLIDKYIMRGVGTEIGLNARELLMDSNTSILGLIGAIIYPFCYLPLFIYIGSRAIRSNHLMLVLSMMLFLIPMLDALILFSRSFMISNFAMLYFGICLTFFRGKFISPRAMFPALMVTIVIIVVSAASFIWRLDAMNLDLLDSIFISGYSYTIAPNDWAAQMIASGGLQGGILSSILPLLQYFTHSLFEFQLLWDTPSEQVFTYGALHLAPYIKLLGTLGLASTVDLSLLFPRVGIFTSFFGPLWVDFGWLGPAAMAVFGFIARKLARGVERGDLGALPLYSYFCVVLFFAPVVNFIVSAQGMYVVNAFLFFWLIMRPISHLKASSN